MINEERVLKLYCNSTVHIMNMGHNIIPSTCIAKHFDCTLYRARKIIKGLVEKGLLEAACENEYSSYDEMFYIVRGYRLTKKGRASKEFFKAQWREAKICSRIWGGGSPYDYLRAWRK